MLPEDHHLTDSADEVLDKAEAFLRRRRVAVPPASDDDVPILTDIVPESELDLPVEAPPPADRAPPAPPQVTEDLEDEAVPEPGAAVEPVIRPEPVAPAPQESSDETVTLVPAPMPMARPESSAFGVAELLPRLDELDFELPAGDGPEPEKAGSPEPAPLSALAAEAPEITAPPGLTEEAVAIRVAEALTGQRQILTLLMEEWLNFDLPTIIKQEFEGANERIVRRSLQDIHTLLETQINSGKKP
ncbi:MAG: hypothetical protein PHU46_17305 [Rhodocyclaceae bacterium]|nr:hypothetical protein [Rhodocyclaceae bacterium]